MDLADDAEEYGALDRLKINTAQVEVTNHHAFFVNDFMSKPLLSLPTNEDALRYIR
jgi:hypothetical protein